MFVEIVHYPPLEMDSYTASPHGCCACAVQCIATLIKDVQQNRTHVIHSRVQISDKLIFLFVLKVHYILLLLLLLASFFPLLCGADVDRVSC